MSKARMYSKLVERCIDCPNCTYREFRGEENFCIETNKDLDIINANDYAIPDWCPLRIAPPE